MPNTSPEPLSFFLQHVVNCSRFRPRGSSNNAGDKRYAQSNTFLSFSVPYLVSLELTWTKHEYDSTSTHFQSLTPPRFHSSTQVLIIVLMLCFDRLRTYSHSDCRLIKTTVSEQFHQRALYLDEKFWPVHIGYVDLTKSTFLPPLLFHHDRSRSWTCLISTRHSHR